MARAVSWVRSPESLSSEMLTCSKRARTSFSSPCSTLLYSFDLSPASTLRRFKSRTHRWCFSWSWTYSAIALPWLVIRSRLPFHKPGADSSSISQTDSFPMQHATSSAVNGRLKRFDGASADTPFETSCVANRGEGIGESRLGTRRVLSRTGGAVVRDGGCCSGGGVGSTCCAMSSDASSSSRKQAS